MKIRTATLEDIATLRIFEQGVIESERPFAQNLQDGEIQYYDLPALINGDSAQLLVVEIDKQLVACGYARIEIDKPWYTPLQYAYLGFMYVAPDYRGRGVNKAIIDALVEWGKGRAINAFKLEVFARNQAAIQAYEKAGFKADILQMLRLE